MPSQTGVTIMTRWMVDGEPASREEPLPLPWPVPLAIEGNSAVIDLGTPITPVAVEMRLFQSVDNDGMPTSEASSMWCHHASSSSGCQITREENDETWKIAFTLPVDQSEHFIVLTSNWGTVPGSALRAATGWLTFDAVWLFAVTID